MMPENNTRLYSTPSTLIFLFALDLSTSNQISCNLKTLTRIYPVASTELMDTNFMHCNTMIKVSYEDAANTPLILLTTIYPTVQ